MRQVDIIARGTVYSRPEARFGYCGWPSLARLEDGTLVAGCSGLRMAHVCPWGRGVLFFSRDEGRTWTSPVLVNDTPLDDRDVGLLALDDGRLLMTWFTLETRFFDRETGYFRTNCGMTEDELRISLAVTEHYPPDADARWAGSWTRLSRDGGVTWEEMRRAPVTSPHGPLLQRDGSLLWVGKEYARKEGAGFVGAYRSADEGKTWEKLGEIPFPADTGLVNFFEPHAIGADGRVLCLVRYQDYRGANPNPRRFSMYQTVSDDGGRIWSEARPIDVSGSPPHLLRHSSGALVCVYGRREEPCGEMAMLSRDNGDTWETDFLLDPAPDSDMGYPASVELEDGSLLTVYYQHRTPGDKASILWTRWRLPR